MKFGSLFSGIGGIDLGLERAGLECVWQVENDPYCQKVLAKHWPNVRRHDDVLTFCAGEGWEVPDLIAGGFPCQDISNAGKRAGIEGERSGLWGEFARIIRLFRPRFVLVENVAALLGRGIERVLGDLAQCGYDAEWDCLPAAAFGALHIRNRVFLLAYARESRSQERGMHRGIPEEKRSGIKRKTTVLADQVSDTDSSAWWRGEEWRQGGDGKSAFHGQSRNADDAISGRHGASQETVFAGRGGIELSDWWAVEPDVGRVAHGVPARVDRLRGLGNAVVPQVAEWIGKQLIRLI